MYGMESLVVAKQTEDWIPISSVEPGWPLSYKVSIGLPRRTRSPSLKQPHGYFQQSWCPLSSQPFKANFDGVVFNNSHSAGVGVIIRDRNGKVIAAMSERIPLPSTVLEVEAMACRRAEICI